jgi:DNA-binding transcriptional regulator LsrR (DeoR family)
LQSVVGRAFLAGKSQAHSPKEGVGTLSEVARLYYIEDLTQEQIARRIGGSRSNVSRMLREARKRGLVEIRIRASLEAAPRLEEELKARLGLRECLVLSATDLEPRTSKPADDAGRMASFTARYLQENISDNSVLGVGWSRTIYRSVNSGNLKHKSGVQVVQLMGSVGSSIPELNGISIATRLAEALEVDAHYLHAPMLVTDSTVRDGLLRDRNIQSTMEIARRASTIVVGIGEIGPDHGQYLTGYLDDADLKYIRNSGAVCDICGTYFARDGSLVPLEMNERTIAVDSEDIRRAPNRIAVSWGAHKALANIGAVRSGLINILITDESAAEKMLILLGQDERVPASSNGGIS